jgi:hypothetical protein
MDAYKLLFRARLCATAAGFVMIHCTAGWSQINVWTGPVSANWETMNWSLGILPNSNQWVMIANAGYKAVGIFPMTPINFPDSMTVSNLTIDAPVASKNTLLLNYSGTALPLRVRNQCDVGTNGRLLNLHAGFFVDGNVFPALNVSGELTQEGGYWSVTNGTTVVKSNGQVNLNGNCQLRSLLVQGGGAYNQSGGTALISNLTFNAGSTAHLTNGTLQGTIVVGQSTVGTASFIQYGGTVRVDPPLLFGFLDNSLHIAEGGYTLQGGTIEGNVSVATQGGDFGGFAQLNGVVQGDVSIGGHFGFGTYDLDSGEIHGGVSVSQGRFVQSGGSVIGGSVGAIGEFNDYGPIIISSYIESNGIVSCTNLHVGVLGFFYQYAGTNTVTQLLELVGGGEYSLNGGTLLASNATLTGQLFSGPSIFYGAISQSGGVHKISNALTNGGSYALLGGSLEARDIILRYADPYDRGILFVGNGASLVNSGRFIHHGTLLVSGASLQLGELYVSGTPSGPDFGADTARITFGDGTTVVRFASSAASWGSNALLKVIGWKGSLTGGGTNQLFIGNNPGSVTAAQLGQIQFDSPYGTSARILGSGEIVPGHPLLNSSVNGGKLVLMWQGTAVLQAATNVLGPYTDVPAASPYTNISAFPQRFFRLRANW